MNRRGNTPSRPSNPASRKAASPRDAISARGKDQPLRYAEADLAGPAAVVSRRAADRLRAGHLWVYRSEVESLIPALGHAEIQPGALVTILDARQIPLGSALFSSSSELTLRKVSSEPRLSRGEYLDETRERVRRALALRAPMLASGDTDSLRLIFAEADNLPGILADRYNDLVILQLLAQGTAQDDLREVLAAELATAGVRAIVERPDPRIRELEQLAPAPAAPLLSTSGDEALTTTFTLNGLRFQYDANSGQKTGAFLDQRLNYAAAAKHARGRGLDVCTYQGGFALHLARGAAQGRCDHVTAIDQSRSALEIAEANYTRNREAHALAPMEFVEADAFELLRHYDSTGERFDTVVLDPPAFAKSRRAVEGALRGYKELNLRAVRMLNAGGTLVTCSCSHHIALADFTEAIASAAADAGRHVRLLETRAAAPDHPEVLTLPETRYLKCLILAVD
ncbi:class I SAM-dependent rRNA methyltransferase [Terriglobus aquaticus]|uniref:Class I SAM-dependent rRNA methyltransferase n=1 Tax=Terriglobus aquaticus TaxID=940139 RepID=A0ABW9KG73_9BACT|nr:class I SAM-dependent rRNA methyltransferase [Terriglobus aquaticus]